MMVGHPLYAHFIEGLAKLQGSDRGLQPGARRLSAVTEHHKGTYAR